MNKQEFQLTNVGLPNTCYVCGVKLESAWYARNDDEARSGEGYCPQDAGFSPKAKPGRPRKKKAPSK
jgi:hypothetical protein